MNSSSSGSLAAKVKEIVLRWKYLATALVVLTAVALMTAVVAVQITNIVKEGDLVNPTDEATTQENSPPSSQLKYVLNEIASNIDSSVDPCEDFYQFACGSFAKRYSIPRGRKEVNYHTLCSDEAYHTVVHRLQGDALLSDDTIAPLKYLKRVWDSCVNDDSEGNDRMDRLMDYFEELDKLDWQERLAKLTADGFKTFFTVRVTSRSKVVIGPPEQLEGAPNSCPFLEIKGKLSETELDSSLSGRIAIDHSPDSPITEAHEKVSDASTSRMTLAELSRLTRMDWTAILRRIIHTEALWNPISDSLSVTVEDVQYFERFGETLDGKDEDLKVRVLQQSCFFLGNQYRDFQFRSLQAVDGIARYQNKSEFVERTCFDFLSRNFEDLLFRVYHPKNSSQRTMPSFREFLSDLPERLSEQLSRTIENICWMDEETKAPARELVDMIISNDLLGGPAYIYNDADLRLKYSDLLKSTHEMDAFDYFLSIISHSKRIEFGTKKLNRFNQWPISLFSIRPYLSPETASMLIPPFFMYGPFTSTFSPSQIQLGFFGWLLAQQWTHTFDRVADYNYPQYSDAEPFWSHFTRESFNGTMQCLVDVYDGQEVDVELRGKAGKAKINGTFSLDENLADVIALDVAYQVYKDLNSTSDTDTSDFPEPLKQLADERLFFLSFANVHCSHQLKPVDVKVVNTPPPEARVNTALSQTAKFAEVFKCKPGSKMNPVERCSFT